MIIGGLVIAVLSGPVGLGLLMSATIFNTMIGIGLSTALAGTVGLLQSGPNTPASLSPDGQLPIQTPNPLWRIVYGLFQFAGTISFIDGPILNWVGTGKYQPCESQWVHQVHTLAAHQIAGFLAVVIDGQTYNFGTDIVLLTSSNTVSGRLGPPGYWGFLNAANPWTENIFFSFDCGNPSNTSQPFPLLQAGATMVDLNSYNNTITIGSNRWTAACLQRGRAKVHVMIHYSSSREYKDGILNGVPEPYVLGSGRIPTVEFKIVGRLITDYRIPTLWLASTHYAQYAWVLAIGPSGSQNIFVQQTSGGGTSGSSAPNFQATAIGSSVSDGVLSWLNCGAAIFAAGATDGSTTLINDQNSSKLVGSMLMADAWHGGYVYGPTAGKQVIEAPIGYLQYAAGNFTAGTAEPTWNLTQGGTTSDNGGSWTCLGRSPYATATPDNDGTENQGGCSNPSLVVADYLTTPREQFGLGAKLNSDSIATVIAAANICDEAQAIEVFANGDTLYERSYACNGCFDTSSAYGDVLKSLALSMAGYVVPPGDCWRVYAGSWVPPEVTLTDADARGPIKADFRVSLREACNGVKGQYIPGFLPINPLGSLLASPASAAWKKTDFPPVQRSDYVNEDGGIFLWKDIQLDFTISLWMAQRIAKIVMERLRRQATVSFPAKATPLALLAGDTVNFNHSRWEGVYPPLPTSFFISHLIPRSEDTNGVPAIGVDLVLRQTDASVYAFTPPSSSTNFGDYSPYGQTGIGAGNVE